MDRHCTSAQTPVETAKGDLPRGRHVLTQLRLTDTGGSNQSRNRKSNHRQGKQIKKETNVQKVPGRHGDEIDPES